MRRMSNRAKKFTGRDRKQREPTISFLKRDSLTQRVVKRIAKDGSDLPKMTFKSLMNLGGYKGSYTPIDRYHSGPGGYHYGGSGGYHHSGSGGYHHSSRGGYKGKGGNGAALSALTLLAFLFLINIMQQSMQDNNSMGTTTSATIVLRNSDRSSAVVDTGEEKENKKRDEAKRDGGYGASAKSKIQRLNSQYIK